MVISMKILDAVLKDERFELNSNSRCIGGKGA